VDTITKGAGPQAPIDAATAGLEAVAAQLQQRHEFARKRQAVITANPELQERELIKLASWSAAIADTLRSRGVGEPAASLAAEVAMAIFRTAFERWIDEADRREFAQLIREARGQLTALTANP
jgi:hypothetical protein